MSRFRFLNGLIAPALFAVVQPALVRADEAGDDWIYQYGRAHQNRRYRRKQLDVEVERREDLQDARKRRAQRRLDDARDEALQGTAGQRREAVGRNFREQQEDLDRQYDRRKQRLEDWNDWAEGLIRRDYKAAKIDAKYRPPDAASNPGSYPYSVYPGWRSGPGFGWYPGSYPGAYSGANYAGPASSSTSADSTAEEHPPASGFLYRKGRAPRRSAVPARNPKADADKRNAGWLFRGR